MELEQFLPTNEYVLSLYEFSYRTNYECVSFDIKAW